MQMMGEMKGRFAVAIPEKSKEEQDGLEDTVPLLALLRPQLSTTVCTTSKHAPVNTRTIFNITLKLIFLHVHTGCTSVHSCGRYGDVYRKRERQGRAAHPE